MEAIRTCNKCKRDYSTKDSLRCSFCTKQYLKTWREKNKDKIKLYTQSSVKSGLKHCSVYVARAVKKGKLINLKTSFIYCDFCKKARAVQYEHRDYNKPLEVKPVCVSCNRKLKSAIKRKKLTNK